MFTTFETHVNCSISVAKTILLASVLIIKRGMLNLTRLRTAALHNLNFIQPYCFSISFCFSLPHSLQPHNFPENDRHGPSVWHAVLTIASGSFPHLLHVFAQISPCHWPPCSKLLCPSHCRISYSLPTLIFSIALLNIWSTMYFLFVFWPVSFTV